MILSRCGKSKTDPRRRLPAHVPGDGRLVPNGGRLPRLRSTPALASRVRVPSVRRGRGTVGDGAGRAQVYGVQRGNLADSRHGVPGHLQAVADVVAGDVVHHQPEEWGERLGPAASAGPGQRRDGLDLAAHAAQGHGAARAGAAHWRHRDRETAVGGPEEGTRGRETETKALVVVATEKRGHAIGRIRVRRIKDGSAKSLRQFIRETIEPGSTIQTDGWRGDAGLEQAHEVMPRVPTVAARLTRWLLGTLHGGIQYQHLDDSLDAFTFRFHRRRAPARGLLFHRLAQQAVAVGPAPCHVIISGPRPLLG